MAQIFEITTENGKMFCKCKKEGGTLVLIVPLILTENLDYMDIETVRTAKIRMVKNRPNKQTVKSS
jgi:hypothetical protein